MTLEIRTAIGAADAESVQLRGHDLVNDLLGTMSFTEGALLAITGRRPTGGEVRVVDAVLLTFIDHGLQPSALTARLTYHVAPEAVQGAVAAGLLGVGSRILGTMEQTARLLTQVADAVAEGADEKDAAHQVATGELDAGRRIPGVGHALHRDGDPRTDPLLRIAQEEGIARDEVRWLHALVEAAERGTGRRLPLNAAGASAALLLGVGVPWRLQRGVAMISRTAGLVAHIGEESEDPVTPSIREQLRAAGGTVPGEAQ